MIMSIKPNFKVGDEVEFIENYGGYTVGERARVIYVDTDGTVKVANLNFKNKPCWVFTKRLKLVAPKDPVLTPEEVFGHLRKGTKLQQLTRISKQWVDVIYPECVPFENITTEQWRVKPEPEVIELNGKRYKLIED